MSKDRYHLHRREIVPPTPGPGTDGPVWSEREGKWTFPLNAQGRAVAEAFFRKYPHPSAGLSAKQAWLRKAAVRLFGVDEVESIAATGVVQGAAKYDPAKFGCQASAFTYLVGAVYFAVRGAVARVQEAAGRPCGVRVADEVVDQITADRHREREVPDDLLARYGGRLDAREVVAVWGHYTLGWRLRDLMRSCGGVSRERVRQLCQRGIAKLRAAAGVPTPHTPGERIPPTGAAQCPNANRRPRRPDPAGRVRATPPKQRSGPDTRNSRNA